MKYRDYQPLAGAFTLECARCGAAQELPIKSLTMLQHPTGEHSEAGEAVLGPREYHATVAGPVKKCRCAGVTPYWEGDGVTLYHVFPCCGHCVPGCGTRHEATGQGHDWPCLQCDAARP